MTEVTEGAEGMMAVQEYIAPFYDGSESPFIFFAAIRPPSS